MNAKSKLNLFKELLVDQIGEQLQFIILEGSYNSDSWVQSWSDIDFLIGVKDLSYEFQISLPTISRDIGNKFNIPISLDAVSLDKVTSPNDIFL